MKIFYTSDVHGYYFPTDYNDREEKPMGLLSISENYENTDNLIIDGGDILQGSAFSYYRSVSNDAITAANIMNKIGVNFVTLGNHDFNYGHDFLRDYVNNLNAHVICCNVTDLKGEIKNIRDYEIIERDGKEIGIIGAVTDWVNIWEKPENKKDFVIQKTLPSLMRAYENIKDCDFKICIYHGGIEFDPETLEKNSDTDENVGGEIVESIDLDLLLTGHQHMNFTDLVVKDTLIVQPGSNGQMYVEIDIDLVKNNVSAKTCKTEGKYDVEKFKEELEIEARTQDMLDEKIAELPKELLPQDHLTMAMEGSDLAIFMNIVQMDATGADISVVSFANEILGLSKNVTMREVLNTYRFPNTLVVLAIDGKNLRKALNHNYKYVMYDSDKGFYINPEFEYPKKQHYNFDFFYGIDYELNLENPQEKIGNIYFNDKLVKEDDKFTIVMNNYRATGIAGFDMYLNCERVKEINLEMSELIVDYLKKHY